jgi:hypothetical protein
MISQKAKVVVKQVDKSTRRLKFSEREADPDSRDLIQKKAELMVCTWNQFRRNSFTFNTGII